MAGGHGFHLTIGRIETANLCTTTGKLRFEISIKVINVRSVRLIFPWHFGIGQPTREENPTGSSPFRYIGTTSPCLRIPVSGPEPHGLILCQHTQLAAVRTSDANITPIVSGIRFESAGLEEQP